MSTAMVLLCSSLLGGQTYQATSWHIAATVAMSKYTRCILAKSHGATISAALQQELWQEKVCLEANAFDDVQDLLLFVRWIPALVQEVLHVTFPRHNLLETKTLGGDATSLPGKCEPRPVSWLALLSRCCYISSLEHHVTSWPVPQPPDPVIQLWLLDLCVALVTYCLLCVILPHFPLLVPGQGPFS